MSRESLSEDLERAYEILLGAPLASFDAGGQYAVFVWDDMTAAEFFEELDADDLMVSPEPTPAAACGVRGDEMAWSRFEFDLARSFFLVDELELEDEDALEAIKAATEEGGDMRGLFGAALGALLKELALDPAEIEGVCMPLNARLVTDGTLADAMRAATWTMNAPEGLWAFGPRCTVEPRWEKALAAVRDPALRDHLRMLCLTAHSARGDGAWFAGRGCPGLMEWLASRGHRVLAAWEFGEGQASLAVFQMRPGRP